jgi:hypothetical protein
LRWLNANKSAALATVEPDPADRELRAFELLKANLSPEQLKQFEEYASIDVVGGETGRRYRILRGSQLNIYALDRHGMCMASLCVVPRGRLPVGDIMLAQKLGLELFELDLLRVANKSWPVRF